MLHELTHADFTACLRQRFELAFDTGTIGLELVTVDELPAGGDDPTRRAPFSVIFVGPVEPFVAQGMYRLRNERLGELELFIVPIGPDAGGMRYEAVFN